MNGSKSRKTSYLRLPKSMSESMSWTRTYFADKHSSIGTSIFSFRSKFSNLDQQFFLIATAVNCLPDSVKQKCILVSSTFTQWYSNSVFAAIASMFRPFDSIHKIPKHFIVQCFIRFESSLYFIRLICICIRNYIADEWELMLTISCACRMSNDISKHVGDQNISKRRLGLNRTIKSINDC